MHSARLPWKGGLDATSSLLLLTLLALAFAVMRAVGIFGPAATRWLLPLGFVCMALSPWLLMSHDGRRQIGLVKPEPRDAGNIAYGAIAGALAALACFVIGLALFGATADNWFVSIANNYKAMVDTRGFSMLQLHLVFTLPAILFSPFGEEIFFRGVLQRALEQRWSASTSTTIECAAFGVVHLCHHGLFMGDAGLAWRPLSGALWVALMFITALMFAALKKRGASLLPAIGAHMAFNAVMNLVIFAALW